MPNQIPYYQGYPPTGYPYPQGYPIYPQIGVPPGYGYPYGMYQMPPGLPPNHYPIQGSYQNQYPAQSQYGPNYGHRVPSPYMNLQAPIGIK